MGKLVGLLCDQLPGSAQKARLYLLERLEELEFEATNGSSEPATLRSIHAVQQIILASDPLG
ncbi:hypothetical protein [Methylobacterium sp. CM6247]